MATTSLPTSSRRLLLLRVALVLLLATTAVAQATPPTPVTAITAQDFARAFEHLLPALQDLATSAQEMAAGSSTVTDQPAAEAGEAASGGRRLLAPVTTTQLRTASRVNLLASDAFSMVYTGGNFARAVFALMQPMVVAGQTGTISVDTTYLLNMSSLLAQYVATLGDMLSKGARLTADGILPI